MKKLIVLGLGLLLLVAGCAVQPQPIPPLPPEQVLHIYPQKDGSILMKKEDFDKLLTMLKTQREDEINLRKICR